MKRAVRKRAGKLRAKALKSLGKSKGSDLQSVSNRESQAQYSEVLALFESPTHENIGELVSEMARSLMQGTRQTAEEVAPGFISETDLGKIECSTGCSWCCRQPLQVSILGAISVAAYILENGLEDHYSPLLESYVQTIAPYENDYLRLKECFERCPFLGSDDRCGVYQARPVVCRAFHSTDKACCERVIVERSKDRNIPMFSRYFGFIGMRLSGARQALKDMGFDDRPVVLGAAVKLLLDDFEGVTEKWIEGENVFEEVAVVS